METNYSEEQAMRDAAAARARIEDTLTIPSPWWHLVLMSVPFPLLGLGQYLEGPAGYILAGVVILLAAATILYASLRQESKGVRPSLMKEFTRDKAMLIVSVAAGIFWLASLPIIDINGWASELHLVIGLVIGLVFLAMLIRANRGAQRAGH